MIKLLRDTITKVDCRINENLIYFNGEILPCSKQVPTKT